MFNLRWFYQIHVYLIDIGVLTMLFSVYIIMFKKNKPWRVKVHKRASFVSVLLIVTGVILMYFGKESIGLDHFTVPHSIGGIIALIALIVTPTLAYIGLKGNPKLLKIHKIAGKVTAILTLLVSVFGIMLLLSYIS